MFSSKSFFYLRADDFQVDLRKSRYQQVGFDNHCFTEAQSYYLRCNVIQQRENFFCCKHLQNLYDVLMTSCNQLHYPSWHVVLDFISNKIMPCPRRLAYLCIDTATWLAARTLQNDADLKQHLQNVNQNQS
ncbi:hypothetical protein TNCV_1085601 [Trichonephila clavipes]|nr:hypothetical protein TNCV_1085601 [Trichonephila clavipes]